MKKIYYAHCQAIYGTPQEERDIKNLQNLGFEVINPADFDQDDINHRKEAGENVMDTVFIPAVERCNAIAFRALPDGRIPAGVWKEMEIAAKNGLPYLELPSGVGDRMMSIESTREYLTEVGQR